MVEPTNEPNSSNALNIDDFVDCARYGELEDMQTMLQSGGINTADADAMRAIATTRSSAGYTALHVACANGEIEVVRYLLPFFKPEDLRLGTTLDGSTPLHWASLNGKAECVELLLAAGADATFKNEDGRSAVTVAEQQGHLEVVNLLLKSFEPGEDVTGGEASGDLVQNDAEAVEEATSGVASVEIKDA
ncbi:hypothetical protein HDU96_000884 [Phlyctochytrium bullatum]|nr:hypothetical protein HDU96_000884 [Phlyctochytrium bullatum]